MEPRKIKILFLLEAIDKDAYLSQREISKILKISLGLVNSLIKKLILKGMIDIVRLSKNRVKYRLTYKGVVKKDKLSKQYFALSIGNYKEIKRRVSEFLSTFSNAGINKMVFYGAGDITEIACIVAEEDGLRKAMIIDDEKAGGKICGVKISEETELRTLDYDAVLISDIENNDNFTRRLISIGVPSEKIVSLFSHDTSDIN